MKLELVKLDEPDLQFATGSSSSPKEGLLAYGPYSLELGAAHPARVRVGLVGPPEAVASARMFLQRCRKVVPSGLPDSLLAPEFPGFWDAFHSDLTTDPVFDSEIDSDVFTQAMSGKSADAFAATLALIDDHVAQVVERDVRPDVVAVCIPSEVRQKIGQVEFPRPRTSARGRGRRTRQPVRQTGQIAMFDLGEQDETIEAASLPDPTDLTRRDFRRALKAAAMRHLVPIQILTPGLFEEGRRRQQDAATRAWNLSVALFYKAGGIPWRITPEQEHTCFVGVSFHHLRTADRHVVYSSLAQAFSTEGDGFALRGSAMPWDERDKQVHLTEADMRDLLGRVLTAYRDRTGRDPLRVVVHKTTEFDDGETRGARTALRDIPIVEMLALRSGDFRLVRQGGYPPDRGMVARIGGAQFLFTGGFMPSLRTYPGPHIPVPLELVAREEIDGELAARDVLSLTKMNWNSAASWASFPITLSFARQVGAIMSEVPPTETPHPAYRFYM